MSLREYTDLLAREMVERLNERTQKKRGRGKKSAAVRG